MMAYLDSVSERNLDPAWMRTQLSPFFCCSTNPRPRRLASVQRRVGLSGLKKEIVGEDVRACLAVVNAHSRSGAVVCPGGGSGGLSTPLYYQIALK